MKKVYKLNIKPIVKLLKENLIFIGGMILFFHVIAFLSGTKGFQLDWSVIKILLVLVVVWNVPALFLLAIYFFRNKKTVLEIDNRNKSITIFERGIYKTYQFSEIDHTIFNLGIFHKTRNDGVSREKMFISDFGYLDLIMINGDRYTFTSLMIDFLHEKSFLPNTNYRYRIIPFIDNYNPRFNKEPRPKTSPTLREVFEEKYRSMPIEELREILNNKDSYQKIAIETAKFVMKEKTLGNKDGYNQLRAKRLPESK